VAVDGPSTPVIEHMRMWGTVWKFSTEGVLPTTVDRGNTCITVAVRMLLYQAEPRSRSESDRQTVGYWEWTEPQSASMYFSPRRRCFSLIPDAACWTTTHAVDQHAGGWVIPVWWQFIYDWRLLKLSAAVPDDWSCLMQPRCVVHTCILVASGSFSRLSIAGSGETWCLTN